MPNDNVETILTLISGNLALFNRQLEKQNKALTDLAEAVKNQKITVTAPDVKVNFADLKVPAINIPPIQIPKIEVPKAEVEVKIPPIRVPEARVTVTLPKMPTPVVNVPAPIVNIPEFPREFTITHLEEWFERVIEAIAALRDGASVGDFSHANPLPVRLIDLEGKAYKARGGGTIGISSGGASGEAGNPVGYQQLTVTTAAGGLTIPDGATRAVITVEGDSVRWRDDGTAPGPSTGIPMMATQSFELPSSGSLANFQVIQDANATSSPILNINYYKL